MIRALLKRKLCQFGARYDYDTSYLAGATDADLSGVLKLVLARPFLYHRGQLPAPVWRAAHLRATVAADCGPCLKLAAAMAEEEGISKATIAAVLRGKTGNADLDLAIAYAEAVIGNDAVLMDRIEDVRRRFGEAGLVALAAAVVSGGFYPLLKRGLGYGMACAPVLRELEQA